MEYTDPLSYIVEEVDDVLSGDIEDGDVSKISRVEGLSSIDVVRRPFDFFLENMRIVTIEELKKLQYNFSRTIPLLDEDEVGSIEIHSIESLIRTTIEELEGSSDAGDVLFHIGYLMNELRSSGMDMQLS